VGSHPRKRRQISAAVYLLDESLPDLLGRHCLKRLIETPFQFVLPLRSQSSRYNDEHPFKSVPRLQFLEDVAGLDRLAQTHIICNENALAWIIEELQQGLELVGQQLGAGSAK